VIPIHTTSQLATAVVERTFTTKEMQVDTHCTNTLRPLLFQLASRALIIVLAVANCDQTSACGFCQIFLVSLVAWRKDQALLALPNDHFLLCCKDEALLALSHEHFLLCCAVCCTACCDWCDNHCVSVVLPGGFDCTRICFQEIITGESNGHHIS
jgi:hypothetical protein